MDTAAGAEHSIAFEAVAHRRRSFLRRKSGVSEDTPPELKAITQKLKERPTPTGDDVLAADLIPTAISMSLRRKSTMGDITAMTRRLPEEDDEEEEEASPEENVKDDKGSNEKGPQAPDALDDAEEERRRRIKRTVSCLLCTVVCVVIIVVILFLFVLKPTLTIEDLACDTAACHEVMHIMDSFVDHSVKPCDDLYKHSCGYWLSKTSHPSSFMEDVAQNYSRIIRDALRAGGIGVTDSQSDVLKYISGYYGSCVEFFGKSHTVKEIVAPLLEYLNITARTWLETRDKQAILDALVGFSVRFRLHSFFRIDATERLDSPPTWSIERGWAFMVRVSGSVLVDVRDRASSYLEDVLQAVDARVSKATVTRVLSLDLAKMAEAADAYDTGSDADEGERVPIGNLTCSIFHGDTPWLSALQSVPGDTQMLTAKTAVSVSSFKEMCRDLVAALGHSDGVVGPIYSLALMAAEILRYDFLLSGHGDEEKPSPEALHGVCYEVTQKAFRRAWPEILSAFLGLESDAEDFVRSYIKSMTAKLQAYTDWMLDDDRQRVERKFAAYGLAGLDAPRLSNEKLRCSRYSGFVGLRKKDFIYNRIAVYAPTATNCSGKTTHHSKAVLKYLEGTELVVGTDLKVVVVPHMFGLPPMYYRKLKEAYVNYALGGTVLARKFFRVVLNGTWAKYTIEKMLSARQCYLGMSTRFHDMLSEGDFHDLLSTAEAFRVAYNEKASSDRRATSGDAAYVAATDTVFFKLACQALCSTRDAAIDPNALRGLPSHAACLYAAGTMRQFHSAFQCTPADDMWDLVKCKTT